MAKISGMIEFFKKVKDLVELIEVESFEEPELIEMDPTVNIMHPDIVKIAKEIQDFLEGK